MCSQSIESRHVSFVGEAVSNHSSIIFFSMLLNWASGLGITNFNPSTTTPRNPYGPAHSTGGSSGGSGAAVGSG